MKLNKIAIIGAGPSGLVAAKECLDAGMQPTVFESQHDLGGVWHPEHGKTWAGMKSLLSTFHMAFSDFPFQNTNDFPSNRAVFKYLKNYAAAFKLAPHIHYENPVTSVHYTGQDWRVTHLDGTEQFDGIIMANGVFAKPAYPRINHAENFKGHILHSNDYKKAADFKNRHVAVIGSSFSAYEIAEDIAMTGTKVEHIFRTPAWLSRRYIDNLPYDLRSYRYKPFCENPAHDQQQWLDKLSYIERRYGNPGDLHPALSMNAADPEPANIVIASNYPMSVRKHSITPHRDIVTEFHETGINLASGRSIQADTVIFCTGYHSDIPLNQDIAHIVQYNARDMFQPLLLNKSTLHPHIPSLAFTGLYRGPYFGAMEMQARWAAGVFSGQIAAPDKAAHRSEIAKEIALRYHRHPRPAFPRGDYVGFMLELAKEIGATPHDLLYSDTPMIPADFRRSGIGEKNMLALAERDRLDLRLR